MRISEDRRNWFYQRLIGLKDVIKHTSNKKKYTILEGEIKYIETMLRADEFCIHSEYPIF